MLKAKQFWHAPCKPGRQFISVKLAHSSTHLAQHNLEGGEKEEKDGEEGKKKKKKKKRRRRRRRRRKRRRS